VSSITELINTADFKYITLTNDNFITPSLKYYGEYAPDEMTLLENFIPQDGTVLDIGANIGTHTLYFARRAVRGEVLAFEPQRFVQQILCGNVALNGFQNVRVFYCAVGKEIGEVFLPREDYSVPRNYGGMLIREHFYRAPKELESVPLLTIDSLNLKKVDLMKLDVETMEEEVLRGAFQTIHRHQPVLYLEADRKEHRLSLLRFIETLGYTAWLHRPGMVSPDAQAKNAPKELEEHLDFMKKECAAVNLLCAPTAANLISEEWAHRFGLKILRS